MSRSSTLLRLVAVSEVPCYRSEMTAPGAGRATYEDLLALAEDARGEVLAGEIVTSPSPLPRQSKAQGSLRRFVGGPFDDDDGHGGPGGWWIFVEVDVRLGPHDIVRPDLAGWRRQRLQRPGTVRPIDVAPDWACEVLSPATAALDRVRKRGLYARAGIPHYWIVDPDARVVEALALRDGAWTDAGIHDEAAVARIPPFESIELEVGRLFLPRDADE
jgi:Uma2 family endonuclease